jgi:hypothetical protein
MIVRLSAGPYGLPSSWEGKGVSTVFFAESAAAF